VNVSGFLEWAHQCLLSSDEAQEYLLTRGVSKDQWARHNLGFTAGCFVPEAKSDPRHNENCGNHDLRSAWCDTCRYLSWSAKWVREDEGSESSKKIPLWGARVENSVVLPLTSYSGTQIGFQTRSIIEKQYDTYALSRRPEGYFFGMASAIHTIWSRRSIVVVEGPFDHLIMERLVCPNVVSLTTNAPGKSQANFIRRFVDTVYCCLDNDKAGKDGFASLRRYLPEKHFIKLEYPCLRPGDKDVGDFWKRVGDVKFKAHFLPQLI
jgi:DNA primase